MFLTNNNTFLKKNMLLSLLLSIYVIVLRLIITQPRLHHSSIYREPVEEIV